MFDYPNPMRQELRVLVGLAAIFGTAPMLLAQPSALAQPADLSTAGKNAGVSGYAAGFNRPNAPATSTTTLDDGTQLHELSPPIPSDPAPQHFNLTPGALPWSNGEKLPTESEASQLGNAWTAAQSDAAVLAAAKTYAECYRAANQSLGIAIPTIAMTEPRIKQLLDAHHLESLPAQQNYIHGKFLDEGYEKNPDNFLPNPDSQTDSDEMVIVHYSGALVSQGSYEEARKIAVELPNVKPVMEKLRAAYSALDKAIRTAMSKDPAVKDLVAKYPYLLYGRRDLGFIHATQIGV